MTETVTLLRGMRFPCNPEIQVYSLQLEYVDVIEVRWPNGVTEIMNHCMRAPGTYDTEPAHGKRPDFWVRMGYSDYSAAIQESFETRIRHGDGDGDPYPIPDLGELNLNNELNPEFWGHSLKDSDQMLDDALGDMIDDVSREDPGNPEENMWLNED